MLSLSERPRTEGRLLGDQIVPGLLFAPKDGGFLRTDRADHQDLTLVVNNQGVTGGTHALIIGVSSYPHLDAKPEGLSRMVTGLRSLRSPADSAREVATWFAKEYHNPDAPIATVDLLLSDGTGQGFTLDGVECGPIGPADLTTIISAANAWKRLGDVDPDGLMVFYFCGHGMTAGFRNALLASDTGAIPARPMRGAFDPDRLLASMKTCGAAKQIYLLDACRAANEELFKAFTEEMDGLVAMGNEANSAIAQAVFYSTRHGAPAYGPNSGGSSLFTQMLLKAFNGMAANQRDGPWRINTSDIQTALTHLSKPLYDPTFGDVQAPTPGTGASFDLHQLQGAPRVPFYLLPKWHEGASPPIDVQSVEVGTGQAAIESWASPWNPQGAPVWSWAPDRFRGVMTAGQMYASAVRMTDGTTKTQDPWYLSPPYRAIEVD